MGTLSGPKIPDPFETAEAQAKANTAAARETALINQFNQQTPFGSVNFTGTPGEADRLQTIQLAPAEQEKLDLNNQLSILLQQAAVGKTGGLFEQGPVTAEGLPDRTFNVGAPDISGALENVGGIQQSLGNLPIEQILASLGSNPTLVGGTDFSADRQRVEQGLFDRGAARADIRFDEKRERLEVQLINQGIPRGSEAFKAELDRLGREETDAFQGLEAQALAAGGAEQSRLFGLAANQANQQFQTLGGLANFANTAQGQQFSQALGGADLAVQDFTQQLTSAGFGNEQRGTQLSEDFAVRNQLINELSALIQGSPAINAPTDASGLGIGVGSVPIADLIQQNFAQRQGKSANTLGGITGLASAGINAGPSIAALFSNPAFKQNIRPADTEGIADKIAGIHPAEYDYKPETGMGSGPRVGVMEDEFNGVFGFTPRIEKTIDVDSMLGVIFVGLQDLMKRFDDMSERLESIEGHLVL